MSASPLSRLAGNKTSAGPLQEGNATSKRLIAVTRDAVLGRAIEELGGEVSVVIVKDLTELTDQLLEHGDAVALLDAAAVSTPLVGVVESLARQFPDLRLMVAGQAREQNQLATHIANETVFRFVHKPVSPQRLQLFLEAASRESGRRRDPVVHGGAPRPPSRMAFIIAGLVAAAMAVAAAWLFWPHGAAARLNARDLAKVEQMLSDAGVAMAAHRLVSFDGSSAAEQYRDVLLLDAMNERARAGLNAALGGAIAEARQDLADGKLDTATNTMEAVRLIAPDQAGLKDLVAAVNTATQQELADTKARQAMEARKALIQTAVDQMEASIRGGALLQPAGDNAITHFDAAQSVSVGDPVVRSARSRLAGALVAAGEAAVSARHLDEARRYADAAGHINSGARGLSALLWHIEQAATPVVAPPPAPAPKPKAPPALVATPPAAATPDATPAPSSATPPAPADGAPVDAASVAAATQVPQAASPPQPLAGPAQPSPLAAASKAPAPATPAAKKEVAKKDEVISANKLKILRTVPATYPPDALQRLISGWVDLEFVVGRDGSVKEVTVRNSEPGHIFDDAAMRALSKYRFSPVVRNGQPVEQRAALRMRFTAKDQ